MWPKLRLSLEHRPHPLGLHDAAWRARDAPHDARLQARPHQVWSHHRGQAHQALATKEAHKHQRGKAKGGLAHRRVSGDRAPHPNETRARHSPSRASGADPCADPGGPDQPARTSKK
eukprot:scaffold28110_cov71-Phaeocystis_antarctica.AAC.6